MLQVNLEKLGPFEQDPYFTEAREELRRLANQIILLPDSTKNPGIGNDGFSYLISTISHWQACNWDVHSAVASTKEDDNLLETVFLVLQDHLMIIINGRDVIFNSDNFNINFSVENDGFTLLTDQLQYYKNTLDGKTVAGRRKITRKYKILLPFDWRNMQGALSCDGKICLKVPAIIQQFCP